MFRYMMHINLDLDGVFADFDGGVERACGKRPAQLSTGKMWAIIHSQPDFFRKLEMLEQGAMLWQRIENIHHAHGIPVRFLTGAPSTQVFREQKKEWVLASFGPYETLVLPKREKQLYSGPWQLLIDDNSELIAQWDAKGGYGILHSDDARPTLEKLDELVELYLTEFNGQKDPQQRKA